MTVWFVGAGPGAPDLITVRAQRMLREATVCLYAGSIIPAEVVAECPPGCRLVDTGKLTLDEIVDLLVQADRAGHDVVRLQSGDVSIFSAVAEQARRLEAAGVQWRMVPGVPAFAAAAAALNREFTVPTVGQTIILTRLAAQATAVPDSERLAVLGASRALLVLHLSGHLVEEVVRQLLPHYGPGCPAAVVAFASRPAEIVLRGTLATIADQTREAGVRLTAVIVVGQTLAAEGFADSHLYSADRCRTHLP